MGGMSLNEFGVSLKGGKEGIEGRKVGLGR